MGSASVQRVARSPRLVAAIVDRLTFHATHIESGTEKYSAGDASGERRGARAASLPAPPISNAGPRVHQPTNLAEQHAPLLLAAQDNTVALNANLPSVL